MRYADLLADLEGAMRALAADIGLVIPDGRWGALAAACRFENTKAVAIERATGRVDQPYGRPSAVARQTSSATS